MRFHDLLLALQNSALAHAVSKADHLVGAGLQIVHVLGFVLLLASVVLLGLRLAGRAFAGQRPAALYRDTAPLLWLGLGLTVASGVLMFAASPVLYAYKPIFSIKLGLLAAALGIHLLLIRPALRSDPPRITLATPRAALALAAWFGVGLAGRIIGFV